ncbi:MAG: hypothetical protein NTW04_02405, partial [Elusimicrobia bacterium]|nr:hypothetical protein [Elusimicrobiota bacterium]
ITFENTGNTNVLFVEGEQCESKGKKCKKLYGFRLYSGAVKTLDVPYNKSVEYTYDIGGQLITKTFAEKEDAKTYQEVQKKN